MIGTVHLGLINRTWYQGVGRYRGGVAEDATDNGRGATKSRGRYAGAIVVGLTKENDQTTEKRKSVGRHGGGVVVDAPDFKTMGKDTNSPHSYISTNRSYENDTFQQRPLRGFSTILDGRMRCKTSIIKGLFEKSFLSKGLGSVFFLCLSSTISAIIERWAFNRVRTERTRSLDSVDAIDLAAELDMLVSMRLLWPQQQQQQPNNNGCSSPR
ncbi:hypothetical protein OCU04_012744 [Sclerotinia nivalis]|uniref:Uncharacterized protein n=1 Tax=Sclerotinia nivalis TaxID=352851 RepID=A0A9X0A9B2_9HELO|nr:hypothetical protein OCU04_012744 [Sclerotinia nivalis]